jgi:PAS domain S-box-containing protein
VPGQPFVVFARPAPDNERPESTTDAMRVPADPDPSVAQDVHPTPPAPRRRAGVIVATYAVIATLWIYFSDGALQLLFPDPSALIKWSVYKGLGFVAVTSILLLGMMRHAFAAIEASYAALATKDLQLRISEAQLSGIADTALKLDAGREQAQAQAHQEKLFSDAMIESMPGVLYFYDSSGHFLRWNRNFETVSGYSGDEIAGMSPFDFFLEDDKPELQLRINEVFEKGESSIEAPFLARDGTATPYFFTGKRVVFGGMTCLIGVGIDVSEKTRAEVALKKSEQRYRTTLDNILEACQLIGFDWTYLYLNNAAAKDNRRPNEELLGRTMMECWPGIEQAEIFAQFQRCMTERSDFRVETDFTFPDGHVGWFDVIGQPVAEGIFVLSVDITERKRAERALLELNESLERKVAERTDALKSALVRAEAADRIKSAFLATMSHELRTPLNSIIGFTGIVLQGLAGPLNDEQSKQLGMVRGSARHLLELINDVLDLSKIEAGQLEVRAEPFNVHTSIERVVASMRPLAERKGLSLSATVQEEVGTMVSDHRRLEQILINLINNAIKFTDQGRIELHVDVIPDFRLDAQSVPQPALRARVADTGIGIKSDDLSLLFIPFRQVDSGLTRQHEGTGLGLAICRRLATLLGGEISAVSRWQQGSEFTVTLPLTRANPR